MINQTLFKEELANLDNNWGSLNIRGLDNIEIVKSPSNIIFLVVSIRGYKKRLFIKSLKQLEDLFNLLEYREKLEDIIKIVEVLNNQKDNKELEIWLIRYLN